ncbi:angiotensin-converting enzyme-like [Daphnia carinata]|uniref:angiotensin-converting enzyme-like n=1 Tax=Daphnia carinata TaxID=120202 RepID=UPI00257AF3DC|nr:angiotensin-converting enzyme-like [Daphnia carinata]
MSMDRRLVVCHLLLLFVVACQLSPTPSNRLLEYRQSAEKWLSSVNRALEHGANRHAILSWQIHTNRTTEAIKEFSKEEQSRFALNEHLCQLRKRWVVSLLTRTQQRMMSRLCHGTVLNEEQTRVLVETSARLQAIYSEAVVNVAGRNYTGESEIKELMAKSQNYSVLLDAWTGWRDAVGPPSKELFSRMIEINNLGVQAAGFSDTSEIWKNELGIKNVENVVDDLFATIQPLYIQLYAFVRGRLAAIDKTGTVRPDRPLPAHVLGNMWAQNWEPLLPRLMPNASLLGGEEATQVLRRRYSSFTQLVEVAQDFFLSLGFPPLPKNFWTRSQFVRPKDGRKPVCHGSATNFYSQDDVRLMMCGEINEDDFYTLHHEMGHLYYFMAYSHQPFLFRSGASSAFHEAIGDSIIYAAMTTQHRRRLGFLNSDDNANQKELEIVNLLRQALVKIPILPYSLSLEKWRWAVMAGEIKPDQYNRVWWNMKLKYQGIVPPIPRSEKDFDPASKFHIVSNTPYIRYFLSSILQVQIFQALCDASQQGPRFGKPLNQCDIYGSVEAGNRLREMLSLGSSQPWKVALEVLTHEQNPTIDARPLMDYYRPLHEWLTSENRRLNYTIDIHEDFSVQIMSIM